MPGRLIDSLGTTDELAGLFSDAAVLTALLTFELALARAQARLKMIPDYAATAISRAATTDGFDAEALARDARQSATIGVPLVKALTTRVRAIDERSARFVHFGATSQDLVDTAMILLLGRSQAILARDHAQLSASLRTLSDRHAGTVMLGRTLLQPASPITFGYKVAGWYGAVHRSWKRLNEAFAEAIQLQFGGGAGTLAAYGNRGPELAVELAKELHLSVPCPPWHAHRDRLAAVAAHCGIYTGALGKIAGDIALLMQQEVAEVAEPGGESSAMPHKRNPAGCVIALAAATRTPGLVASFLTGIVQEHERAAGGWQAEWQTLTGIIEACGSALSAMVRVVEGLTVNATRMRENLTATHGVIYAEKAGLLAAAGTGIAIQDDTLRAQLADAVREAAASARPLPEILREKPEISALLTPEQIESIDRPEEYLGATETFRKQLLED